jgi:hypothetical protein
LPVKPKLFLKKSIGLYKREIFLNSLLKNG